MRGKRIRVCLRCDAKQKIGSHGHGHQFKQHCHTREEKEMVFIDHE